MRQGDAMMKVRSKEEGIVKKPAIKMTIECVLPMMPLN